MLPTATASSITQNADIRFLGKLLGDVIREHGGEALFRRIEDIRSNSVDRYRGIVTADVVDRGLAGLGLMKPWRWCAASCCFRCWRTWPKTART